MWQSWECPPLRPLTIGTVIHLWPQLLCSEIHHHVEALSTSCSYPMSEHTVSQLWVNSETFGERGPGDEKPWGTKKPFSFSGFLPFPFPFFSVQHLFIEHILGARLRGDKDKSNTATSLRQTHKQWSLYNVLRDVQHCGLRRATLTDWSEWQTLRNISLFFLFFTFSVSFLF